MPILITKRYFANEMPVTSPRSTRFVLVSALLVLALQAGRPAVAMAGQAAVAAAGGASAAAVVPAPRVRAAAAIVYDTSNGEILWESNSQDQRSIASITKLMTAVVFLEESPDLSDVIDVARSDVSRASTTHLRAGYAVTKNDLLHLTLIASDNAAARALARTSDAGAEAFIDRMNAKAAELGLTSTQYADPSGLDPGNVSSAYDMARLITYVSGDPRLTEVMQKPTYTLRAGRAEISVRSTNQLVRTGGVDVLAGKTGFIRRAGYCLVTLLRLPDGSRQVAVVVLGAGSNASRFSEARTLFDWFSRTTGPLLE
jgi:D-alanyl-D-alanine endopeptidase (penicillin-binding protein 7)